METVENIEIKEIILNNLEKCCEKFNLKFKVSEYENDIFKKSKYFIEEIPFVESGVFGLFYYYKINDKKFVILLKMVDKMFSNDVTEIARESYIEDCIKASKEKP